MALTVKNLANGQLGTGSQGVLYTVQSGKADPGPATGNLELHVGIGPHVGFRPALGQNDHRIRAFDRDGGRRSAPRHRRPGESDGSKREHHGTEQAGLHCNLDFTIVPKRDDGTVSTR